MLAVLTAGCTSSQDSGGFETAYDPFESFNRSVFKINQAVDFIILKPVAATYDQVVPDPLKEMVTNVLRNLATPVTLLNELLQGDWEGAEVAATRFFLNTIVGVGGLADIAAYGNPELAYRSEDFGQTLGVWGAGEGPYLVIPLLGPSNLRDGLGRIVDTVSDPLFYVDSDTLTVTRLGLTVVDARARNLETLDEIERSSLDFYAAIRSLYFQHRRSEISDGAPPAQDSFPDFEDFEDFEDEDLEDSSRVTAPESPESRMFLSEASTRDTLRVPDMLILDLEPERKSFP